MFSFDLKTGYHHVAIDERHQQYLGFEWRTDTSLQYCEFTVLPFGLATAYYAFNKLLRPLVQYWQQQGIRAIIYIDDGIVAVEGKEEAKRTSLMVQKEKDLSRARLVVNLEMWKWCPAMHCTWLEFELDLERGCTVYLSSP